MARAVRRVQNARRALVLDYPFFGALSLRLELVPDATAESAWVDGVSLGFNPQYVAQLTDSALRTLIAHEVIHVVAGHPWRRGFRDVRRWNDACDLSINPRLVEQGFDSLSGWLYNPALLGVPEEVIYEQLESEKSEGESGTEGQAAAGPEPGSEQSEGDDDGNDGEDPGDLQGDTSGDGGADPQSDGEEGAQDPKSATRDAPKVGKSTQPSNDDMDGLPTDSQDSGGPAPKPRRPAPAGEVRDCPTDRKEELKVEWVTAVEVASRAAGKMPAGLAELIKRAKQPQVAWREEFRGFFQASCGTMDYTYRTPQRRLLHTGLYLPSQKGESIPLVIVAVDTSGSVSSSLLEQFNGELSDILESIQPETTLVVYCDALVHRVDEYAREEAYEFEFDPVGRGGTSFVPVFDWVEAQHLAPSCLVYLTDLEGDMPEHAPEYPVLWVTPPTVLEPLWGQKVQIPNVQ